MNKHYQNTMKALTQNYLFYVKNVKYYVSLVNAFEDSDDFEISYATNSTMRVIPKRKDLTMKELSIALDEIFFNLPFNISSERIDSSDMNIYFYDSSYNFGMYISLKDHTKCQIIASNFKKMHKYSSYCTCRYGWKGVSNGNSWQCKR